MNSETLDVRELLAALHRLAGRFSGEGTNHEQQQFLGQLYLRSCESGVCLVEFHALGTETAEKFHMETSMIGVDSSGTLTLWNSNTNVPTVLTHTLTESACSADSLKLVFAFGDPEDRSTFRERIELRVDADSAYYGYSWGLPHGEFQERSAVQMVRQEQSQ